MYIENISRPTHLRASFLTESRFVARALHNFPAHFARGTRRGGYVPLEVCVAIFALETEFPKTRNDLLKSKNMHVASLQQSKPLIYWLK